MGSRPIKKESFVRGKRVITLMLAGIFAFSLVSSVAPKSALAASVPTKTARVNGGAWNTGTSTAPVAVSPGDTIQYKVTAPAPTGVPMMMQGLNDSSGLGNYADGGASWWGQPAAAPAISYDQVATITTVDLPVHLAPATAVSQFLATYPTWNGKTVLKAWDATETDTSVNPDYNTQRVIAWVTAGTLTGQYDLYVGGQGGVWMSASPHESYVFSAFTDAGSLDLSHFHTDRAVNMSGMFAYYGFYADLTPTLDLSHFDTSHVTDMSHMFDYFCQGDGMTLSQGIVAPTLDLSHFDTSKVTDMSYMFNGFCTYLTTSTRIDLSHFNTSKVTDMSYMFDMYGGGNADPNPVSLDLTHFDTSKVTDMRYMFFGFPEVTNLAPVLDLTHFDTSKVTDMSYMFSSYAGHAISAPVLDLTHFDTSQVTNMGAMFSSYAPSAASAPTLDLTHFDTSKVTDMHGMFSSFADNATSAPTLDLAHFDTARVADMSYMFSGFAQNSTTPITLDLSWFKIGVASGGTDVSVMFKNDPQLTDLYLGSGVFSSTTVQSNLDGFGNGMFSGSNASLTVYVGTAADQSWMQAQSPAPPVVTVAGAPAGTQPAPVAPLSATVLTPTAPPAPVAFAVTHTTATDTIPAGLAITASTITGTQSATSSDTAITWQLSGRKITWSVPDTLLPANLSASVTVGAISSALPAGTVFTNTAYVGPGTIDPTNSTYHMLVDPNQAYTVQVDYRLLSANGKAIATDTLPGTWTVGKMIDPALFLNTHKPYGYGDGVAVGTWTVSPAATGTGGASVVTFTVYYPDTTPAINIEHEILYVRQPTTLTFAEVLHSAGVSITDAEEDIPLSKLQESGYSGVKWNEANYPGGIGYQIRLNVSDTPGLAAPYRTISIFVEAADSPVRPPRSDEKPPSEKTPAGTSWGIDAGGNWVIYKTKGTPRTPANSGLPQTGDSALCAVPGLLLIVGAIFLLGLRRRINFGD